jgi:hypothetical protein
MQMGPLLFVFTNRLIGKIRRFMGFGLPFCDNGVGIPAHNMSRIFEPFFTTKGREWDWPRSLGGERDCESSWRFDSHAKPRASRQTRYCLFGLSAKPTAKLRPTKFRLNLPPAISLTPTACCVLRDILALRASHSCDDHGCR